MVIKIKTRVMGLMNRKINTLMFLLSSMITSSCLSYGFVTSEEKLRQQNLIESDHETFRASYYTDKLKDSEREIMHDAIEDSLRILRGDRFREEVTGFDHWCSYVGNRNSLKGISVYDKISNYDYYNIQFLSRINLLKMDVATTRTYKTEDKAFKSIIINRKRIRKWRSDNVWIKSMLIGTISHEIMHTILDKNGFMTFKDDYHKSSFERRRRLVSYRVGKLAQCIYIMETEGNLTMDACFLKLKDLEDEEIEQKDLNIDTCMFQ